MNSRDRVAVGVWSGVAVGWLLLTWLWSGLHLAMTVDDTYYYFKIAFNASRGLGSTFDGVNPTNGYHPLWLGMLALLYSALGDDMVVFTRVVFTLQVVLVWTGGLVLTRLKEAGGPRLLWPLALALLNPFTAKIVLCGQETALQFLTSSVALVYFWSLRSSDGTGERTGRAGPWALLAVLAVLVTLSRLDGLFYSGLLLAMPLLMPSDAERASGLTRRLRTTVIGFAVFGAGLLPYLLWNLSKYGHLMPVSGAIKAQLSGDEIAPAGARVLAAVVSIAGLAWLYLGGRRKPSVARALLAAPLGAALILAVYNFGVRGEMSSALVRIWYLEPYLLVGVLAIGVGVRRLPGWTRARRTLVPAVAGLWIVLALVAWKYRLEPRSYSLYGAAENCSRWLDQHGKPGAVAAAWDAGFAGAFTRKSVMNLDGLVNSWEFKQEYLDRGKVDDFILKRHPVDYVVQYAWPGTVRKIAARFEHQPLPSTPQPQTTVTGARQTGAVAVRWGVDLAPFTVAHVECVMMSVATNPAVTVGPIYYFVLGRDRVPGQPTLAEFAIGHASRTSCPAVTQGGGGPAGI